tara:strand:- start:481 stop:744 length:264 start_codon:yes stop_codon:yes gene_type:complete
MKTLLNNTILRDLQDYKITHRASGFSTYLPSNSLQAFLKMQSSKTHHYKFESPAQRKAERVCNILDVIVLSSAILTICFATYITFFN